MATHRTNGPVVDGPRTWEEQATGQLKREDAMTVRNWSEYEGRQVVVTGAASGMGEAAARLLSEAGARVVALDIKPVSQAGYRYIPCDLSSYQAIEAAIGQIDGEVEAVFACAGLAPTAPPRTLLLVNLFGTLRLVEGLLPKVRKGGAIAMIASLQAGWFETYPAIADALPLRDPAAIDAWIEGATADGGGNGYQLSKYALIAYTYLNAPRFISDHGVRLNVLCPGKTDTPMMADFRATVAEQLDQLPVPQGRNSTAEEQAHAMLFLNSPLASYLVGVALPNDGGSSAVLTSYGLNAVPGAGQA